VRGGVDAPAAAQGRPPGPPSPVRRHRLRNGEQVKQLTGQLGPRSERERMEEVRAIAGRAGIDEAAVKRGATYTEIVQAVGDSAGTAASVIYLSWKLCSGIAHGDFWPTWSAMQRVELPGAPQGTGAFKIEANVKLLMYVTTLAADLTRYWLAAV
jgi:hypothetical protein